MRDIIKRSLILIGLFTLIFIKNNCSAENISGGFEYEETSVNGEVKITGYRGVEDHVIVPEYLAGKKVTEIGNKAFAGNERILSCDLSGTRITNISDMAFADCTALKEISTSPILKSVGDSVFSGCSALESMDFPFFMESVGEYAFYECISLEKINQEGGYLRNIGAFAFYGTGISSFTVPVQCMVGNSTFPQDTHINTSKSNKSISNMGNCHLSYVNNFTIPSNIKKTVIAGQNVSLVVSLPPGTWCVWQKKDTGEIFSKKSMCNITALTGNTVYLCHISNGVYTHDVVYIVTGNTSGEGILAKVSGISATEKNNCVILKWKKSKNSDGYVIYRSTKSGSGYKKIGMSKSTKFKDKTGKRGKTYFYKICTYKMVSGERICGQKSSYKKYKLLGIPATPHLKINKNNYIIWSKKNSSGVVIYVKRQGVWLRVKRLAFSKYHQNSVKISAKSVSAVKIKLYFQGKGYKACSKFSNVVKMKRKK